MANKLGMKQKLHSLLLLVVLLSWSIVIAASDFDDGILKYTITSSANLEVRCDGFTDAHKNDTCLIIPDIVSYNGQLYSVCKLDEDAFEFCKSLVSVNLDKSKLTFLSEGAFSGCTNLVSVTLSPNIKWIRDYAFESCKSLAYINLENVESIGEDGFYGCISLKEISIESLKSTGSRAFAYCDSLKSIDLNKSRLTSLAQGVFEGCKGLTTVVIPSTIFKEFYGETTLSCFRGCTSLETAEVYSNVIPGGLFERCTSLKSVILSSNTKFIYEAPFAGCSQLKYIQCLALNAPTFKRTEYAASWLLTGLFRFEEEYDNVTLVVPQNATGYDANFWNKLKIPAKGCLCDYSIELEQGIYAANDISYSRDNIKPGSYATFCLPFDTNLSEVSDAFENVYTANQTALYKPDGKLILLLQKIDKDASISAGQPFVAKLKDNVTEVTFCNNKLMTVDSDIMQNGTPTPLRVFDWDGTSGLLTENTDIKVSYGGALSTMTGVGSEYETFNSNGTFGPTKGGQVKAFRAYVLKEDAVTQGRVKSISFGIEGNDGTTNIETIVDSPEKNTDKMVYSIDGRLVNTTGNVIGLPSGIYIKNHQKIYVK